MNLIFIVSTLNISQRESTGLEDKYKTQIQFFMCDSGCKSPNIKRIEFRNICIIKMRQETKSA